MTREIYLDNSATTRVFPEVADRIYQIYVNEYGNPSSMHHKGVEAEKILRQAAETLAGILKTQPKNLIFTSCGSESDNLAIIGTARARAREGKHLVTMKIEHPGVLEAMRYLESEGYEVTYLPVDRYGLITAEQVKAAVRPDTLLVSVMHVNNEIGAVEPIAEIGAAVKEANPKCLFHVDAVQSFMKVPIYPAKMKIDLLTMSGHKIHAPKGVAALYVADGVRLKNLIYGGGQQGGLRSGTDNVPGVVGMAMAAKILYDRFDEDTEKIIGLRDRFIRQIREIPDVRINGPAGEEALIEKAAPHIISFSVKGVRAEVLLHAAEEKGVYVSSGSACSTHHKSAKGTIDAIGADPAYRDGTIRVSLSVYTTEEEIDEAAAVFAEVIPFLRRYTRH